MEFKLNPDAPAFQFVSFDKPLDGQDANETKRPKKQKQRRRRRKGLDGSNDATATCTEGNLASNGDKLSTDNDVDKLCIPAIQKPIGCPTRNRPLEKRKRHRRKRADVDPTILLKPNDFPSLTKDEANLGNSTIRGGAWADTAFKTRLVAPAKPDLTADKELGEHSSLLETSTGLLLTILAKDRAPSDSSTTNTINASAEFSLLSTDKKGLHDTITEEDSLPTLQVPQINMTKLRDKWWDALREQQRRLNAEKQLQEEKGLLKPQSSHSTHHHHESPSAGKSIAAEEYVETQSLSLARETAQDAEQMPMNMELTDKYLPFSHPIHWAIMNHDRSALDALIRFCANPTTMRQLEANNGKIQMSRDITRLSALQLAVKLDKPDLLQILIHAAAVEREQARWIDSKTRDNTDSFLMDALDSVQVFPTPLMMAAELGHSECADVLLGQSSNSTPLLVATKDENGNNALHYCCGARDEAPITGAGNASILRMLLHVILNAGGAMPSRTLCTRNHLGQTALHVACQRGRISLVEVFLEICGSGSYFAVFVKLLSMKDHQEQTPLLSAVASGSTDLVMTLLVWRGNRHHYPIGTRHQHKLSNVFATWKAWEKSTSCPLVWAMKTSADVDMVRLLLEFQAPALFGGSNHEGNGYNMTLALQAAVLRSASHRPVAKFRDCKQTDGSDNDLLEIIRTLIENGANPCEETDLDECLSKAARIDDNGVATADGENTTATTRNPMKLDDDFSLCTGSSAVSALTLAVCLGHSPTLVAQLDSLIALRKKVKETRRRDPRLRKQPESFFRDIEAMEDSDIRQALSNALIASLFLGRKNEYRHGTVRGSSPHIAAEDYLSCSYALFLKGAKLGLAGLARLKCSLSPGILFGPDEAIVNAKRHDHHCYDFRTGYRCDIVPIPTEICDGEIQLSMKDRSELLYRIPWMKRLLQNSDRVGCEWMKERSDGGAEERKDVSKSAFDQAMQSDLVVLLTENGKRRFVAHGSVISNQSAKLEAAVRFAKMTQEDSNMTLLERQAVEIDLGSTPSSLCLLMLQHLYHGSFVCGLPSDPAQCCQSLLDLLLLSEEFLCFSLMQECEMRLLSNNPWQCFCWSCNRQTTFASTNIPNGYSSHNSCVYIVRGPPKLLTPTTVIDVVAVAQHLEETRQCDPGGGSLPVDVAICLLCSQFARDDPRKGALPRNNCLRRPWSRLPASMKPLGPLREVSINVILNNFPETLQSDSYSYQLNEGLPLATESDVFLHDDKKAAALLLLRMCLDELALSDFNKAWSVQEEMAMHLFGSFSKLSN